MSPMVSDTDDDDQDWTEAAHQHFSGDWKLDAEERTRTRRGPRREPFSRSSIDPKGPEHDG